MKNLDLHIQVYRKETIEAVIAIENEIEKTKLITEKNSKLTENKKFSSNSEKLSSKELNEIAHMENELNNSHEQIKLAELTARQLDIELLLIQEFLMVFPHRRESMSLNYISKQLGISISSLFNWLNSKSLKIEMKKQKLYVSCRDFIDLIRQLAYKNYEINKAN